MTVQLSLRQLQAELPELLDHAVESGNPVLVRRKGKEDVVIVSARQWRKLSVGKLLDAKGPDFRLSPRKQRRVEALLAMNSQRRMSPAQRRELDDLLAEADEVMLRRGNALDEIE